MLHKIILIGNLGREPETRYTPTGKQVTTFSVATNRKRGDKTYTTWFRVSTWGKLSEICAQYLNKGDRVYVEGRLNATEDGEPRAYTDKSGNPRASYEVTAEVVRFLSPKQGEPDHEPEPEEEETPF